MTTWHSEDEPLEQLLTSHREGLLSRREVLKRGAALGIAASSIASALAGARAEKAFSATSDTDAATAPRRGGTLIEGYDRTFSPITTTSTLRGSIQLTTRCSSHW